MKQLILFALAEDADEIPNELTEACKHFINADSTWNAKQELNLQFKNLGLQDAAFSPGLHSSLCWKISLVGQSHSKQLFPFLRFQS